MAEKHVDARGLACPQPVVLTRKAMLEPGVDRVHVVVDSEISAENIQRLAQSQGWERQTERLGQEIHLALTRGDAIRQEVAGQPEPGRAASAGQPEVVVFVASNLLGVGDEKLGQILMKAFVKTIKDLQPLPKKMIFVNSGVFLTTAGSEMIGELRDLEQKGVLMASCGTCLDYYHLMDSLQVGVASNMYDIASWLVAADRIVRP